MPPKKASAGAAEQTAFPVVGIGASAGGVEALQQLLKNLPTGTGMAFVYVQHLDPTHKTRLPELLAKSTSMPVAQARHGVKLQPNRLYTIPHNAELFLQKGILHLRRRRARQGAYSTIDDFFRSLAEAKGGGAVGVLLSGAGTDGVAGMRQIKAEGGITFAQSPQSAKHANMPRSAIEAGVVDFVLRPREIALGLARLAGHPYLAVAQPAARLPVSPEINEVLPRIFFLLRNATGVDFTYYKHNTLLRRISRRMALLRIGAFADYARYLESHPRELEALYRDFLIHVTSFFREPGSYRALKEMILARILPHKPVGEAVRVWVPGCSTGEEVYSIAICLMECLGERLADTPVQLFGTDISEEALEKARAGVYSESSLINVPPTLLRRFFNRVEDGYQVVETLRKLCLFARQDLTRDPPFSQIDLISCRNVFIYMGPVLQEKILNLFHYALRDHGVLLLGKSEGLGPAPDLFSPADKSQQCYVKKPSSRRPGFEFPPPVLRPPGAGPRRGRAARPSWDVRKEADRVILNRYAPPGILVSEDLRVLQFRGQTGPYLEPAPGEASMHLLRIVRSDLLFELRSAIEEAKKKGSVIRRPAIPLSDQGRQRLVDIEVIPVGGREEGETCFLVLFRDSSERPAARQAPRKPAAASVAEVSRLRRELAATREYLQSIVEEQEATNEELTSVNEELVSSNEELQSTNEELETAKEEVQSANEELVLVNEQLQQRNTDLRQLSDDLTDLVGALNIPVIMLDGGREVRRYTPGAERFFNLRPEDLGSSLDSIRPAVSLPALNDVISAAIESGAEQDLEVRDAAGRWHCLRLRRATAGPGKEAGALLLFIDIDALKRSREALSKEHEFLSAVLDTVGALVVVLDRDGRIVSFNRACQRVTSYSPDEVQGKRVWDLLLPADEVGLVKRIFADLLTGQVAAPNLNHWITKDGARRLLSWTNTVLKDEHGSVSYVIRAGLDVTDLKRTEDALRESEATVRALLEAANQAILAVRDDGSIFFVNAAAERIFGYSREELLRRPVEDLMPKRFREMHIRRRADFFPVPRTRSMGAEFELLGRRRDGSEFPAEVSLSHIECGADLLAVAFVADITARKQAEESLRENESALRASQEQLRALTAGLIQAQEEERRRISRELHDDLNQKLAMLAVEVETLERQTPEPDLLRGRLRVLRDRTNEISDDVRRTAYQLHPSILEHVGLPAALKAYCADFSKREGIRVLYRHRNLPESVPPEVALCLYRIAQESLRNVAKHARARRASVVLQGVEESIRISVSDTGVGFDPVQVRGKKGLGIISMEERVRLQVGTLTIRSRPGHGARVTVTVPLPVA